MKEKEILEKMVGALWADGIPCTYNWSENYRAAAYGQRQNIGSIRRREWKEVFFLLKIQHEGKEPENRIFFTRAECNEIVKKIVQEFTSKKADLEASFRAEHDKQVKAWEREHGGKLAVFQKETEQGTLRARALIDGREIELRWSRPNAVSIPLLCGYVGEVESEEFEHALKHADAKLFQRLNTSATDPEFVNDAPLVKRSIEVRCGEVLAKCSGPSTTTLTIEVPLPPQAAQVIAERKRRLRGE